MDQMSILTLTTYMENVGETLRVTLQAHNIMFILASEKLVERQSMNLYHTTVQFVDGNLIELFLTSDHLHKLEEAVGSYGFPY